MSLRYIFRLIEAFFKRFKAIILIGIFLGISVFLLFSILIPNIILTNQRIGLVGRYTPDFLPEVISSKISGGLTKVDESGNVSPSIAKSWESADGGKTWIFELDENIVWQDGKKVNTRDVDYKFSDATVEIIDDTHIKFSLDSQFSAFPIIVSRPLFKKGLVGTGDWRVRKINLSGGYLQKLEIINRNKNEKVTNKISYSFYPSEERLKLAFKLGEVDIISAAQDSSPFDSWKVVNVNQEIGYNNFVGLFFNTEDEKLSDKVIRQSLAYAIDKSRFPGERALGPISPNSWAYNPQVKQYQQDLEKTKDAKGLKVVLSTLPNLLKSAEMIKSNWDMTGIDTEIRVVTNVPDDYQVFLATVDIPKDPDQYSLWHSTQTSTNISKFKNPRIDKLLEDGRLELNQETRKKIYLDFQRFIVEEVPAVFLYHPTYYTITRK